LAGRPGVQVRASFLANANPPELILVTFLLVFSPNGNHTSIVSAGRPAAAPAESSGGARSCRGTGTGAGRATSGGEGGNCALCSACTVTPATAQAVSQQPKGPAATGSALGSDRATFSSAGNEVAQTAGDASVRMDKVAGIQAALAAGSYSFPAAAVASKVVDSMMAGQQ